jgi:DNA polymerase-3 subunit gamma/tau
LQTILAAMQILDQTLARMRYSTQARILAELALVRICDLEDLEELSALIVQLQAGQPLAIGPPAAKKKFEPSNQPPLTQPTSTSPIAKPSPAPRHVESASARPAEQTSRPIPATAASVAAAELDGAGDAPADADDDDDSPAGFVLDASNAAEIWRRAIEKIPGMVGDQAKKFFRLDITGINRMAVVFAAEHAFCKTACQRPEQVQRFEQALKQVTGQPIRLEFKVLEADPQAVAEAARPTINPHQRLLEAAGHPLVRRASELFGAEPTAVEEG